MLLDAAKVSLDENEFNVFHDHVLLYTDTLTQKVVKLWMSSPSYWYNITHGIVEPSSQHIQAALLTNYAVFYWVYGDEGYKETYRKTSIISRTKSQNFNVSHLVLQLSLPNPLKPNVKLRMKM